MDSSIPVELLLKSIYPEGVELRWGKFDFPLSSAVGAG